MIKFIKTQLFLKGFKNWIYTAFDEVEIINDLARITQITWNGLVDLLITLSD